MRIDHRIRLGLLPALVAAGLGSAESAEAGAGTEPAPGIEAAAAVSGLDLNLFGSPVALASTTAMINLMPEAAADAVGATSSDGGAVPARADSTKKREAFESCVPELTLVDLLDVRVACSESRAQLLPELFTPDFPRHLGASLTDPAIAREAPRPGVVDNGGPQAVARGSVAGADIRDVGPLAASMGLVPTDSAGPVATLLRQLLDGSTRASALVSIKLAGSTATTNIDAREVVALAQAGDGQIDLLPGLAPGGGPLLSVVFSGVRSVSRLDRSTGGRSSVSDRPRTKIRLGVPLAGDGVTELDVGPDAPVTVLAGTPLETTISAGVGREVVDADGSVSFIDGASLQMLKGVRGGIDVRLGHAESSTGDRPAIPDSADAGRWLTGIGGDARDRAQDTPGGSVRLLVLGAGLILADLAFLSAMLRRRRRAAQAWPAGRRCQGRRHLGRPDRGRPR